MITFEEAMLKVRRAARPLPPVKVPVAEAAGRALAEDVRSALDMPPFDKSAVDGYAVRAAEAGPGAALPCAGLVQAGQTPRALRRGSCLKVMTGAPVPAGADAVVMVEETSESGGRVAFSAGARKGANIARRGEDIRKGELILKRGSVIGLQHIAALAAAGRGELLCGALPTAAVVNTGGEIVPPGAPRRSSQIYNSNGPLLSALLRSDGIEAEPVIVKDDERRLRAALAAALKSDIVLISGGVSMGDYDLVPGILKSLGVKKVFHNVRVRPGKPMFFGVKGRRLVFGIPGNPLANFLAYLAYVRPAVRLMARRRDHGPLFHEGACAEKFDPRTNRRALVLSTVKAKAGFSLAPVPNNGSADILSLAEAAAFALVPEGGSVKKGGRTKFLTWLA